MKILPLIYPTAAEIWLHAQTFNLDKIASLKNRKLVTLPSDFSIDNNPGLIKKIAADCNLTSPLMLLAPDKAGRVTTKLINSRTKNIYLPEKTFIKLGDSVFAASPELCLLQAARTLSLPELIRLGTDLCAGYVLNAYSQYGQVSRLPLASIKSINNLLNKSSRIPGVKNLKLAVKYILENSGSPMETKIAILSVLPTFIGGYGLPRPLLNHTIALPGNAAKELGYPTIKPDLTWFDEMVAGEYDGKVSHLDSEQHEYDKRRYNALTMAGFHVVTFTAAHMSGLRNCDEAFAMLRDALGLRSNLSTLEKYRKRREEVFACL